MEQTHLSDSEIQAAIDGAADADLQGFRRHLEQCPRCRREAEAYRNLAVLLDTDPAHIPVPGLEERVMSVLPAHPDTDKRKNLDMILALGGFSLVTAASLFIGGWKPLADILPLFGDIVASGSRMISRIDLPGNTGYLIPCAGLALLFAALLDHAVFKKHNGMAS